MCHVQLRYHLDDGDLVANFFKLELKDQPRFAYDLSFADSTMDRRAKERHVYKLTKMIFAAMHGATEVGGEKGFFTKEKRKALHEFQHLITFDGTKLLAPMELQLAGGEQLSGPIELPSRPSRVEALATAARGEAAEENGTGADGERLEAERKTKTKSGDGVLVTIKQIHDYVSTRSVYAMLIFSSPHEPDTPMVRQTRHKIQPHDLNIFLNKAQGDAVDENRKPLFHRYGRDFFDAKDQPIEKCADQIKVFFGYSVAADRKYIGKELSLVVKVPMFCEPHAKICLCAGF
jgi:hypothetical protein